MKKQLLVPKSNQNKRILQHGLDHVQRQFLNNSPSVLKDFALLKTHESSVSDAKNNPKSKTNKTDDVGWIFHRFLSQKLTNFGPKSIRKITRWSCARSSRSLDPQTGGGLGGEEHWPAERGGPSKIALFGQKCANRSRHLQI